MNVATITKIFGSVETVSRVRLSKKSQTSLKIDRRKFLLERFIMKSNQAYLTFSPSISSDCSARDDSRSR